MEAKVELRGQVYIVELNGRLDFESLVPFRRTCMQHLSKTRVVFDLRNLNFVGSLGLQDFVATLDDLTRESKPGVKFCGVGIEFRRLFEANGFPAQDMVESQDKAIQAFDARSI